jgi:hypothetical protein
VSVPWYREGRYLAPHHQALARTLTCGRLTCGRLTCALFTEQVTHDLFPLWKWWKEFDVETAKWTPWFEKDPRVKATPDSLHLGFHQRPGKLILLISNLTKEAVKGVVELDLQRLGLSAGAFTAEETHGVTFFNKSTSPKDAPPASPSRHEVRDGRFRVTVGAENYSVIRLSAE